MRVIYFSQHYSTPQGSAGIRPFCMSKKLLKMGHDVTIVCGSYSGGETGLTENFLKEKREGTVDGIRIIEFDLNYSNHDNFFSRSLTFLRYALKSIKLIFTEQYDLIFVTSTPLTSALPGVIGRWVKKKPFILEIRDLWPELPRAMGVIKNPIILKLISLLEWIAYHSAHHIIALSPGIQKGIISRGINIKNTSLIPNGCDLDIFKRSESNKIEIEGIDHSDFIATYAGTHGVANNLDSILDVASVLKRRKRNDIKFLLIGQGKEKETLILRSKEESLSNIIFLNPVNKRELANYFHTSDIGLQVLANVPAFYYGTSPNKFFDYISSELPVITNYPGWIADLITVNKCGFVANPDDPENFADLLEKASCSKDEIRKMGYKALRLAESEFSRDKLSTEWVNVIEREFQKLSTSSLKNRRD